jgi:hypothetical protein
MNSDNPIDARTRFVFTRTATLADAVRRYPSTPNFRLVFHDDHIGEVREKDGEYRCPLSKGYTKISFVTMAPSSVPLVLPESFLSSDKLAVRAAGDIELSVKPDGASLLSVALKFDEQFTKVLSRVAAIIGKLCSRLSASDILAGKAAVAECILQEKDPHSVIDVGHIPLSIVSVRISLEVPVLKEKVAGRTVRAVDLADELQQIDDTKRVEMAKLAANKEVREVTHKSETLEANRQRVSEIARLDHELKKAAKQSKNDALIENNRLEVVKATLKVIGDNKVMLGLINPQLLAAINQHEEEIARIKANEEAVQKAQERFLAEFERVWAAVSKNPSAPTFIFP